MENKVDEILEELYRIGTKHGKEKTYLLYPTKEAHQKIIELLPPIEKAHTYASENADIYRAYDNGQKAYKQAVLEIFGE